MDGELIEYVRETCHHAREYQRRQLRVTRVPRAASYVLWRRAGMLLAIDPGESHRP